MNIEESTYSDLVKPLNYMQVAPPCYSFIIKFLSRLDRFFHNELISNHYDLTLLISSVVPGILTLPLFAFVSYKLTNSRFISVFGTSILACNTHLIGFSSRLKQYSLECFIAILLLYVFLKIDFGKDSYKKIILFSLIIALSPWFSGSSVIIIGCGILYIIFNLIKNKNFDSKKVRTSFYTMAIGLYIYFALYLYHILITSAPEMFSYWQTVYPAFFTVKNFCWMFATRLCSVLDYPLWFSSKLFVLIVFGLIMVCFNKNKKLNGFLLLTLICTISLSFLKKYPFVERLLIFLVPYFVLIFSGFLYFIKENFISRFVFYFLISVFSFVNLFNEFNMDEFNSSKEKVLSKFVLNKGAFQGAGFIFSNGYFLYGNKNENYYFKKYTFVDNNPWADYTSQKKFANFKMKLNSIMPNISYWVYLPQNSIYENNKSVEKIIHTIKTDKNLIIEGFYFMEAKYGYIYAIKIRKSCNKA